MMTTLGALQTAVLLSLILASTSVRAASETEKAVDDFLALAFADDSQHRLVKFNIPVRVNVAGPGAAGLSPVLAEIIHNIADEVSVPIKLTEDKPNVLVISTSPPHTVLTDRAWDTLVRTFGSAEEANRIVANFRSGKSNCVAQSVGGEPSLGGGVVVISTDVPEQRNRDCLVTGITTILGLLGMFKIIDESGGLGLGTITSIRILYSDHIAHLMTREEARIGALKALEELRP